MSATKSIGTHLSEKWGDQLKEAVMSSELWHHGVIGMKWGIRRSKEELAKARGETVETQTDSVILENGQYQSSKGFTCKEDKMSGWCLNPEKKHWPEFAEVGYRETDSELLMQHIHDGYDLFNAKESAPGKHCHRKFTISMDLGVTEKRNFVTAWAIENEGEQPKFVTAYREDPKRKED